MPNSSTNSISYEDFCVIMSDDVVAIEFMKKAKALNYQKLKEKVLEKHKRKITPKRDNSRGTIRYQTICNGESVTGASEEAVIYELAKRYNISIGPTTVAEIFELGLKDNSKRRRTTPNTLNRTKRNYKRFITEDFANMDITVITAEFLNDYTHDLIERLAKTKHPLKKEGFLAYKGVLNTIFDYANNSKHRIIPMNPLDDMEENSVFTKELYKPCVAPDEETDMFTLKEIIAIKEKVKENASKPLFKRMDGYYVNGFVLLVSIETGMRIAELCALKWSDIKDKYIWIHSQQLIERTANGKGNNVYDVPWTKNEKMHEGKGRKFPLWENIKNLLSEIKEEQNTLGIESEYVFAHRDGRPVNKDSYEKFLTKFCKKLGFTVTNNHAFRKTLNSLVFIPMGIREQDRATMLGHTVKTNLNHYTKSSNDYIDEMLALKTPEILINTDVLHRATI